MDLKEYRNKMNLILSLAKKCRWETHSTDSNTFRISLKDELSIYRIDIYLSKMTICFLPTGEKPKYFKRQNLKMIENIMLHPENF